MEMTRFEMEDEPHTVKSAKRVLQILEYVKETGRPLSTTDIAVRLNYPISSTAALLKSLANLGYLVFDRNARTYHASVRIGLLGRGSQNDNLNPRLLNAEMERLARTSGQTIILGLRNDIHIQYVRIVAGSTNVRFYLPVGSKQRLVDTTMGQMLLSLDDDRNIDRLVRRANAETEGGRERIDPLRMRAIISAIRSDGYAYSSNGFFKGASILAMPLQPCSSEPALVLGLGGSADDIDHRQAELQEMLAATVRQIARNSADTLPILDPEPMYYA